MKTNFDQLRRNIAGAYNRLAPYQTAPDEATEACDDLRNHLAGLLSLHDDECVDDMNDLSDEVPLLESGHPYSWLGRT